MKKTIYSLWVIIIFVIAGLFGFVSQVNKYNVPNPGYADTAIVLTGGAGRIQVGLDLLEKNRVKTLFISGVHKSIAIVQLINSVNRKSKKENCCIVLGYEAKNTFDNAIESAVFVKKKNYKSIYLVTGSYHMPRALEEIKYRLPNVKIIPYPIKNEWVKTKEWYLYPGTLIMFAIEYLKTIVVITRISIF